MKSAPRKIVFLAEEFTLSSPAQQLLDRFLLGYAADGEFRRIENCEISIHLADPSQGAALLDARRGAGLKIHTNRTAAIQNADAAIVIPKGDGSHAPESLVQAAVEGLPTESPCFVHGVLANTPAVANALAASADFRRIPLLAGTPTSVTWRLPEISVPPKARVTDALIVVQGNFPSAEMHALEGLLPLLEAREGGESGVSRINRWEGVEVWKAMDRGAWPRDLMAAAISRSDTPLGDPVLDGRTQDLVGLGLVPKLAQQPRCWRLSHKGGTTSTLLVLNGVVKDFNVALRIGSDRILSTQLFRPPTLAESHYDRLAAAIERFVRGEGAWSLKRNLLIVDLLSRFRSL
jgi:hypothetical protein